MGSPAGLRPGRAPGVGQDKDSHNPMPLLYQSYHQGNRNILCLVNFLMTLAGLRRLQGRGCQAVGRGTLSHSSPHSLYSRLWALGKEARRAYIQMGLRENEMETEMTSYLPSEGDEDLYYKSEKERRMDSALTTALESY